MGQLEHPCWVLVAQGPASLEERLTGRDPLQLGRRLRQLFDPARFYLRQSFPGSRPRFQCAEPVPAPGRNGPVKGFVVTNVVAILGRDFPQQGVRLGAQLPSAAGAAAKQVGDHGAGARGGQAAQQ